jgi:hypothetical protein
MERRNTVLPWDLKPINPQSLERVWKELKDIALAIDANTFNKGGSVKEWGGADVVVTSIEPTLSTGDSFYPEPRYVVTPNAKVLSRLFYSLRDAFKKIDDFSLLKIEFFGRLANAALRYQSRLAGSSENPRNLLQAVLHEAFAMLDEMEEGSFKILPLAIGNTIWDDLIERGEASGYLGTKETQRFFDEMNRRHHDDD